MLLVEHSQVIFDLWLLDWALKGEAISLQGGNNCLGILQSDIIPVELEGTSIFLTLGMFLQRGKGSLFESCPTKPKATT